MALNAWLSQQYRPQSASPLHKPQSDILGLLVNSHYCVHRCKERGPRDLHEPHNTPCLPRICQRSRLRQFLDRSCHGCRVPQRKSMPALVSFFQQQEDIQGHELRIHLEKAFQCLSNVKKVSYADLSRISCLPGDCNEPTGVYDYSDGPLMGRLESDQRPSNIGLCCLMNERNAGCSGHGVEFQYRRKFGGLVLLLQVLSDYASTTLEQMNFGTYFRSLYLFF